MADFSSIFNLISSFGEGISTLIGDGNALYGIYIFALFGLFFAVINLALKKAHLFQAEGGSKAAGFVSFAISIFAVGGIFYKYQNVEALHLAVGSLIGFLFVLILSIGAITYSTNFYLKNKNTSKKYLAKLLLALVLFISTSFLIEPFSNGGFLENSMGIGADSLAFILSLINTISFIAIFWFLITGIFGLFKGNKVGEWTGQRLGNELAATSKFRTLINGIKKDSNEGLNIIRKLSTLTGKDVQNQSISTHLSILINNLGRTQNNIKEISEIDYNYVANKLHQIPMAAFNALGANIATEKQIAQDIKNNKDVIDNLIVQLLGKLNKIKNNNNLGTDEFNLIKNQFVQLATSLSNIVKDIEKESQIIDDEINKFNDMIKKFDGLKLNLKGNIKGSKKLNKEFEKDKNKTLEKFKQRKIELNVIDEYFEVYKVFKEYIEKNTNKANNSKLENLEQFLNEVLKLSIEQYKKNQSLFNRENAKQGFDKIVYIVIENQLKGTLKEELSKNRDFIISNLQNILNKKDLSKEQLSNYISALNSFKTDLLKHISKQEDIDFINNFINKLILICGGMNSANRKITSDEENLIQNSYNNFTSLTDRIINNLN